MGEVFAGRYELVDPIGRGGVGAVWRSWDHRRRRYVAAKVLQQRDAHALLRFVREQAMRIDHPHVLAPASWAADDDKVLFTMDLVCGGSLAHLVGDYGPLPPRYVVVLLDQLLAGLSAVHAEGVVHRDIKPANILLEATGTGTPHIRLGDFGIAMRTGDARLTETDYVVGTPGYFAPEQLIGSEPDFPADLYAVGLVALYLLGGQKPDAEAIKERFLAVGTPSAPVGVPEPLWQVIGALLQPDPHARFRTATGARKALAAAAELLSEPPAGEEPVEVFDQVGPLPEGFGPQGPLVAAAPRSPSTAPAGDRAPHPPRPAPPRSKGRHAAPLPAYEPLTHTRTRADPEPHALPLPEAQPESPPQSAAAASPAGHAHPPQTPLSVGGANAGPAEPQPQSPSQPHPLPAPLDPGQTPAAQPPSPRPRPPCRSSRPTPWPPPPGAQRAHRRRWPSRCSSWP